MHEILSSLNYCSVLLCDMKEVYALHGRSGRFLITDKYLLQQAYNAMHLKAHHIVKFIIRSHDALRWSKRGLQKKSFLRNW